MYLQLISSFETLKNLRYPFYITNFENAIFRLGFLPPVDGHGVALPAKRALGLP